MRVWKCDDFTITAPNLQQELAAQHTRAGMGRRTAADAVEAETETERHVAGSTSREAAQQQIGVDVRTASPVPKYSHVREGLLPRGELSCLRSH